MLAQQITRHLFCPRIFEGPGRLYRKLTACFLLLLLAGCIVGIAVPAGPGWDFANFYDTGRRVSAGQIDDLYNPDRLIAGDAPQGTMRFWGTPVSALLYAPLSYFPPLTALVVFKVQNTLAYFAALLLLYLHYRRFAEDSLTAQWRFAAMFAFLSLIYQPFWTVYRVGGQTTPTVFLLLTLALISHTSSRLFLSALCMVLATLIKPAFVIALLLLALVSGVRFFGYTVAIFSVAGLASIALMGWAIHEEFLSVMREASRAFFPWFYNSSLYVAFDNLRLVADPAASRHILIEVLPLVLKATVMATFLHILAKSRHYQWAPAARRHFHFLMAVSFFLLLSHVVWEHYLSALFLLLAYITATNRYFDRRALILVGGIFLLAIGQNLILINFLRHLYSFDSFSELLLMGLFKSGPLFLAWVFLCTSYHALFRSFAAEHWPDEPRSNGKLARSRVGKTRYRQAHRVFTGADLSARLNKFSRLTEETAPNAFSFRKNVGSQLGLEATGGGGGKA